MNKQTLEHFKKKLLTDKSRLERELEVIVKEDLGSSQSEMSGENDLESGEAEAATTTFERERDDSLGWNIRDILNKIDDSLNKIEAGTYGTCTDCDEEIPMERLEAIPYADSCIHCQANKE